VKEVRIAVPIGRARSGDDEDNRPGTRSGGNAEGSLNTSLFYRDGNNGFAGVKGR
jgi:hypothetical protein